MIKRPERISRSPNPYDGREADGVSWCHVKRLDELSTSQKRSLVAISFGQFDWEGLASRKGKPKIL